MPVHQSYPIMSSRQSCLNDEHDFCGEQVLVRFTRRQLLPTKSTIALNFSAIGQSYRFLRCIHSYSKVSKRCEPRGVKRQAMP